MALYCHSCDEAIIDLIGIDYTTCCLVPLCWSCQLGLVSTPTCFNCSEEIKPTAKAGQDAVKVFTAKLLTQTKTIVNQLNQIQAVLQGSEAKLLNNLQDHSTNVTGIMTTLTRHSDSVAPSQQLALANTAMVKTITQQLDQVRLLTENFTNLGHYLNLIETNLTTSLIDNADTLIKLANVLDVITNRLDQPQLPTVSHYSPLWLCQHRLGWSIKPNLADRLDLALNRGYKYPVGSSSIPLESHRYAKLIEELLRYHSWLDQITAELIVGPRCWLLFQGASGFTLKRQSDQSTSLSQPSPLFHRKNAKVAAYNHRWLIYYQPDQAGTTMTSVMASVVTGLWSGLINQTWSYCRLDDTESSQPTWDSQLVLGLHPSLATVYRQDYHIVLDGDLLYLQSNSWWSCYDLSPLVDDSGSGRVISSNQTHTLLPKFTARLSFATRSSIKYLHGNLLIVQVEEANHHRSAVYVITFDPQSGQELHRHLPSGLSRLESIFDNDSILLVGFPNGTREGNSEAVVLYQFGTYGNNQVTYLRVNLSGRLNQPGHLALLADGNLANLYCGANDYYLDIY